MYTHTHTQLFAEWLTHGKAFMIILYKSEDVLRQYKA